MLLVFTSSFPKNQPVRASIIISLLLRFIIVLNCGLFVCFFACFLFLFCFVLFCSVLYFFSFFFFEGGGGCFSFVVRKVRYTTARKLAKSEP